MDDSRFRFSIMFQLSFPKDSFTPLHINSTFPFVRSSLDNRSEILDSLAAATGLVVLLSSLVGLNPSPITAKATGYPAGIELCSDLISPASKLFGEIRRGDENSALDHLDDVGVGPAEELPPIIDRSRFARHETDPKELRHCPFQSMLCSIGKRPQDGNFTVNSCCRNPISVSIESLPVSIDAVFDRKNPSRWELDREFLFQESNNEMGIGFFRRSKVVSRRRRRRRRRGADVIWFD